MGSGCVFLDNKDTGVKLLSQGGKRMSYVYIAKFECFSAAVDYLGTKLSFVDREKIGVIGICGSGGFALSAAQSDCICSGK